MTDKTIKSLSILMVIAFIWINVADGRSRVTTPSTLSTTFRPIDFIKAKDEIMDNIKRQYDALKELTHEFTSIFSNESKMAQDAFSGVKDEVTWYFRKPSEKETAELDKTLNMFYPFGGDDNDYTDTNEKMDEFCRNHNDYIDSLRSWLRRKYSSMLIHLSFNTIITKIEKQTDHICSNAANKKEFVNSFRKIKDINSNLVPAKDQLLDAINFMQNSTYKATKIGRVCCSFWELIKQINENVKDPEAAAYAVKLTKSYFSSATNYLCFLFPYGSASCLEEEKSPPTQHRFSSIILEMVLTLTDMVHK